MQLRPLAPLAVIGAGLLAVSLATHSASASDGGAPGPVDVASVDGGLLVSWGAAGESGLTDYDLLVADPSSGKAVLERKVDAGTTKATVDLADLHGLTELSVSVTSEYGGGAHLPGTTVRVLLPSGPARPDAAPAVRASGRSLSVSLPDAAEGVTGRVVRVYRDGETWKDVSVGSGKAVVTKKVAAGHDYRVAYQDVNAIAGGAFSPKSAAVTVVSAEGPGAVRRIRLARAPGGLAVRWSAAEAGGAAVTQYRVVVTKGGARIGSAYTAGDVRSAVLPGGGAVGDYSVVVVATDADGGTSSSTALVSPTS